MSTQRPPTFSPGTFSPGTFTPDAGPAPAVRRILAATRAELGIVLRNGEQLLLALVIPVAVLLALTLTHVFALAAPRVQTVTPGVLTLAVLSSAFTGQAIGTAFDRRYGVLLRLAAAGLTRRSVFAGKLGSVLTVAIGQILVLSLVAALLGWHPAHTWALAVPLVLVAVLGMTHLALLLGGTMRAEAVLALANLLWLLMVGIGGVLAPLSSAPHWLAVVGGLTPVGALSDGLHAVLSAGSAPDLRVWLVLLIWWFVAQAAAERWFRWQ